MSPSILKPSLAVVAAVVLTASVPMAASANATCRPARVVHKVVHRTAPRPVKALRVRALVPCNCATRTAVRYVEDPRPVVRRVVVYRRPIEPVIVHARYVEERPVYGRYIHRGYVHHGYARHDYDRHDYVRHDYDRDDYGRRDYARHDGGDGRNWRHYGWRDQ